MVMIIRLEYLFSLMMTGSNSSAPIPLEPIKQSISTGFMLSSGRPSFASHMFMRSLPYLSGSASASKPGRPLKVSNSASVFLRNAGKLKSLLV